MTRSIRFAAALLLALCVFSDRAHAVELSVPHPDKSAARVEYFVRQPQGSGPWPTVMFLHGHQNVWSRPGGAQFVDWGVLDRFASRGYLAVSVSLPGYGQSDGPADFAGPYTQHAVAAVLTKLKTDGLAKPDKVLIQGVSLGAVTAALVAARDPTIAGLVLISGLYDVAPFLEHPKSLQAWLLKISFLLQTDNSAEASRARSALNYADHIKATTLILNGAMDDRTDSAQAFSLADQMNAHGGKATVQIFPDYGHEIPMAAREAKIDAFITEALAPTAH